MTVLQYMLPLTLEDGTLEAEKGSIPTTGRLGISSARVVGFDGAPLPPEFYKWTNDSQRVWRDYMTMEHMVELISRVGLVITPAEGTPRSAFIGEVVEYPTGYRVFNIVWMGGGNAQEDLHSLTLAAQTYARRMDCKRIHASPCYLGYKQLKNEGFTPQAVDMIKDI